MSVTVPKSPPGSPVVDHESPEVLRLDAVDVYYGKMHVLQGVSVVVNRGELVCLLGGNASGKSTTLRTALGLLKPRRGRVLLDGNEVTDLPASTRVARGMAIVPENRRLFAPMTVRENLEMGLYLRPKEARQEAFEQVHEMFPLLSARENQLAGTLSGGEQQMVAMARALMSNPHLILMDEPSMGLSPALVERNFELIDRVHRMGVAILVVEQNANVALSIADRGYVLQTGRVVLSDTAANLRDNDELKKAYLGH